MAKKTVEINPNQGALLLQEGDVFIPSISFPQIETQISSELLKPNIPTLRGPEGSYVNVYERAAHLHGALTSFGFRNQRLGFDYASNSRPYDSPIWARYKSGTTIVQEGAAKNSEAYLNKAKQNFWRATGYVALRAAGRVTKAESEAGGRKMWREFSEKYGDPSKKTQRDKYKRQLARQIKNSGKIS